ncbi:ABC-F family ATP-binding cassette domain-containing protein, partial [bacterium]|nr:ABC-F family ATP-binding cassette domain-containing protein [candidate division CSSED10-310 bacterium]
MPHVQLENVGYSFPSKKVFEGVTWRVDETTKAGLVGRNGTGKTTLLSIMIGDLEPENGVVYHSKDLRIGYLRQYYGTRTSKTMRAFLKETFSELEELRLRLESMERVMAAAAPGDPIPADYGTLQERFELAGGYTTDARMNAVIQGLGFTEAELDRPLDRFSGGEANRAALAKILLEEPNLLILDEPTNHLDIDAMEWLEGYLRDFKGGVVMVTHDRYFLDRTVNQVVELVNERLEIYQGGYNYYVTERGERLERARKAFRLQQGLIRRTEDFVARNLAGQKTKQAQSRRRQLEKLERVEKPSENTRSMAVRFESDHYGGYRPVALRDLSMNFGNRAVLRDIQLELMRGDKVGFIGANGSGKSTLLHIIRGKFSPTSGEVELGYRIRIGYYDQQLREVDPSLTVVEDFTFEYPQMTRFEAQSFLGRFLFTGEEVNKPVEVLSGGETARLALAKLMYSRPNLLLL